jgi:hypothetical protein
MTRIIQCSTIDDAFLQVLIDHGGEFLDQGNRMRIDEDAYEKAVIDLAIREAQAGEPDPDRAHDAKANGDLDEPWE